MTAAKELYPRQYMYKQIVQTKLFIDKHFTEDIDLSQMAREAHFSKFHFIRLFKNIYNLTPNQYLAQVRIEQAKKLLENNIPVREVCMSVGFSSISTFKGLYKKTTGEPLSAYQRKQRDLQTSMQQSPLSHIPHCLSKIRAMKKSNIQDPVLTNREEICLPGQTKN